MNMEMLDAGCLMNSSEGNRRCQGGEKFNALETRQDE